MQQQVSCHPADFLSSSIGRKEASGSEVPVAKRTVGIVMQENFMGTSILCRVTF